MPCSVTTICTSVRAVDTTSTVATIVDAPLAVVERTAIADSPSRERDAPTQKSA